MKTLKYFLYTLIILGFFVAARPARAYSITPVKSLFTVDPGSSQTVIIKIKNSEEKDLQFKLSVSGMTQDADGKPVFTRGVDAAESWVYPENNLINIKSGETKSVNFILKVPGDAVSGSYYLGLGVEPVLEKNNTTNLATRLNSLLTLAVTGLVHESVIVEKFEALSGITDTENWKFNLNLKNNGTIEVSMKGMVAIRNWRGEEIFSEPLILGNKLLAGSKRVLHPEIIFKNNVNLPGLYSAQVKINYGRTNQTVSAIAYVWYFPKWSKIVLGGVGLILISLIITILKRPKRVKV